MLRPYISAALGNCSVVLNLKLAIWETITARGWRRIEFQNGKLWGIPPMFFKECANSLKCVRCGTLNFKSPEAIQNRRLAGVRDRKKKRIKIRKAPDGA
jgi:hypothetical protein